MTALAGLAAASLALALLPAGLMRANWRRYRAPPLPADPVPPVSILIPARDEAAEIDGALRAAAASRGVAIELLVLDDGSTDETAAIVAGWAARDARVRLLRGAPLAAGWCGKPHACEQLARAARHPVLLFVDADVRLAPDAARALSGAVAAQGGGLISGFPRQRTGSAVEALVIPLILFVLLGFLPLGAMRRNRAPALAAACGQLIAIAAADHRAIGGHGAIRASLHDGLTLPRALRRHGRPTDLVDATALASCRMYRGGHAVWAGLRKNATEGMARPLALPIWSILLLGGQVAPWLLLPAAWLARDAPAALLAGAAGALGIGCRAALAARFRDAGLGVALHPVGVLLLVAAQWRALADRLRGRPAHWRGRQYGAADPQSPG